MRRTFIGLVLAFSCTTSAVLWIGSGIALGQGSSVALFDNFNKWTTSSSLLSSLASAFTCTFIRPQLGFNSSGLQIAGPVADFQVTGVQSLATFTAPFTVVTQAIATKATANPFELFLVSSDLEQYLAVAGNVNPPVQGFWAVAPNLGPLGSSLGEQFTPPIVPVFDTRYQITVAVNSQGDATVNLQSGSTLLGTLSNLKPGTGPFYLILGRRIGYAATGPQVAYWSYVQVNTP